MLSVENQKRVRRLHVWRMLYLIRCHRFEYFMLSDGSPAGTGKSVCGRDRQASGYPALCGLCFRHDRIDAPSPPLSREAKRPSRLSNSLHGRHQARWNPRFSHHRRLPMDQSGEREALRFMRKTAWPDDCICRRLEVHGKPGIH